MISDYPVFHNFFNNELLYNTEKVIVKTDPEIENISKKSAIINIKAISFHN